MSKQFWAVILAIILVFVAIFVLSNKSTSNNSTSGSSSQHTEGSSPNGITLIEYGDYQCPFCGQYYPILKQIQSQYNDKIVFQFRNFPLVSLHQNAFAGARAAEAAALQNKFWEMHDILYEQNDLNQSNPSQSTWISASNPVTYFDSYATQLGLNMKKFNQDYASNPVNQTINADIAVGTKLGITGTPTFYLDGKQLNVGESVSGFTTLINAEIAKKNGQASSSTNTTSAGTTSQTKTPAKH